MQRTIHTCDLCKTDTDKAELAMVQIIVSPYGGSVYKNHSGTWTGASRNLNIEVCKSCGKGIIPEWKEVEGKSTRVQNPDEEVLNKLADIMLERMQDSIVDTVNQALSR